MLSNPLYHITETDLLSLIGADEQVDQDDYGASVAVTLGMESAPSLVSSWALPSTPPKPAPAPYRHPPASCCSLMRTPP